MPKRKLRIAKRTPPAIGVCERCNARFRSKEPLEIDMLIEMAAAFTAHNCKRAGNSQNPLRLTGSKALFFAGEKR